MLPALVCLLVAALALPASAGARDKVVSADRTATNLSVFGQGLAWSRTAADGQARLVLRGFGAPADLAVAPLSGLFDPDLGQNRQGSAVVVYPRCAGVSGRNCDIYQFDLAKRRESKVAGASSRRCSEFSPAIWQGTVAFARTGPGDCAGLYVKGERGSALRLDKRVPADVDIRQGRVAYLHIPAPGKTVIRLFTIREGRSRVVITGLRAEGERTRVTSPTFAGRYLYWLFEDLRRDDFTVGRSRGQPGSALQFSDRSFPGAVDSIAVEGRALYYANGKGVHQANRPVPRFAARG
jgi:hypothetical protein